MVKVILCDRCSRKRIHAAKGLCASCYVTMGRKKSKRQREMHANRNRRYRGRHRDSYNKRERERNKQPKRKKQRAKSIRKWQQSNKKHLKKYRKKYREKQPDKVKAWEGNRRALKSSAGNLTDKEWHQILIDHNHVCFYCKEPSLSLEQEHKIPLSRGGLHNSNNVVPACRSCNASKFTKTAEEFLAQTF